MIKYNNKENGEDDRDSLDYIGRKIIHLDEVVVQNKGPKYIRRNKLYGYLDSIHTMKSGAWVCKCSSARGGYGYINDYLDGYTHHPQGYCMPDKKYLPKKGEIYTAIKYTGSTQDDYVVDIQEIVYTGDRLTQEELLKEAGLFADQGFTAPYHFRNWDPQDWFGGIEDIRNTLIWIPQAETDEEGILNLVFYTSDITSTFIIRGLAYSNDGNFGDIRNTFFEVK